MKKKEKVPVRIPSLNQMFQTLGGGFGKYDGKNPSATKAGPGRFHRQKHKKQARPKSLMRQTLEGIAERTGQDVYHPHTGKLAVKASATK